MFNCDFDLEFLGWDWSWRYSERFCLAWGIYLCGVHGGINEGKEGKTVSTIDRSTLQYLQYNNLDNPPFLMLFSSDSPN
jgi:hypothetical protein